MDDAYYVGGLTDSPAAGRDVWVLALDAAGTPLWQNQLGGKLDDDLTARLDTSGEPFGQRTFDFSSGDVSTTWSPCRTGPSRPPARSA